MLPLKFKLVCCCLCLCLVCPGQEQDTTLYHSGSYQIRSAQFIAPLSLMSAGLLVNHTSLRQEVVDWRNRHLSGFHTRADDALSLSPLVFIYGLDWAGLPPRTDICNRTAILFKAELLTISSVYLLKALTQQVRPDGTDNHSFPSSHAAQAFLGAAILSEEYGRVYLWLPYAAYTLAGSVALLRIANNRHHIGDVLFGAGVGILAQKITYATHRYRWGNKYRKNKLYKF